MRDGVRLATDLYLPPLLPAPAVAVRTPYSRGADTGVGLHLTFARRGYVVIAQDCRGTGDSEPDNWDYYMYEPEDGYDLVEWAKTQDWFNGFLAGCGGSYLGQTQWQMAMHPNMSTIIPEVSGLGVAVNMAHLYMFGGVHARSVGRGADKVKAPYFELEEQALQETLAGGYFNEPLHVPLSKELRDRSPEHLRLSPSEMERWMWEHYCALPCAGRAELVHQAMNTKSVSTVDVEHLSRVFGRQISHDAHTLPHPQPAELVQSFHAPVLLRTGWYDWALNDALATWDLLMRETREPLRSRCRLLIAPSAHNAPGYHEGMAERPELQHSYGSRFIAELLMRWYDTVRDDEYDSWPKVIYYLMGANEWCVADAWPVPEAHPLSLYLHDDGKLGLRPPGPNSAADAYTYDPEDPTPTIGGSIVSYVYPPGSVDVGNAQQRADVLTYTSDVLDDDLDVVGPLRLVLYASSSAVDTDFVARLTDVFPDGRAIQLQSGLLRARYRDLEQGPELLEPGEIYRFDIDMWATANRFKAGHRLRLDISSADFPRFDRNANRGGEPGPPVTARQTIHHDSRHPSHLLVPTLTSSAPWDV